jgi:hypothetical protein
VKVQAIITFFSHSDHAAFKLENERVTKLEKFSKTRFGAITWVFISLIEAWPAIVKSGSDPRGTLNADGVGVRNGVQHGRS